MAISTSSTSCPEDADIENLVQRSSGLFIFAATVVKFIDGKHRNPAQRLKEILEAEPRIRSSAYEPLDKLYIQIISSTPHINTLKKILGVITVLFEPFSTSTLESLLSLKRGDISCVLEDLHSMSLTYAWQEAHGHRTHWASS